MIRTVQYLATDELVVSHNNPRTITPGDIIRLKDSIHQDPDFLLRRPVLVSEVNGKFIIFGGTQRFLALQAIGEQSIPCFIVQDLSKEDFDKRMLLDNTHYGTWDFEGDALGAFADFNFGDIQNVTTEDLHNVTTKFLTSESKGTHTPAQHMYEILFDDETQYNNFLVFLEFLHEEYPKLSVTDRITAYLTVKYADLLK